MLEFLCTECAEKYAQNLKEDAEKYKNRIFPINVTCFSCKRTIKSGETAVLKMFCDKCGKEIKEGDNVTDLAFLNNVNHYGDAGEFRKGPEDYTALSVDICDECFREIEKMIRIKV